MENTKKSLSDSILELTKSAPDVSESVSSITDKAEPSSGSGFFGLSWMAWIGIILVLAFLGFNIFAYLAQGTQEVTTIFAPFLQKTFGITIGAASQTIDVAAEGAKAVTSATATGVNTGLSAVQSVTPNKSNTSVSSTNFEEKEELQEAKNSLKKTLNNQNKNEGEDEYEPNEASSSVHAVGKAGWCFIGEDRGYRTCSKVEVNDKCMSGDIFPSQQLCINPNLRA